MPEDTLEKLVAILTTQNALVHTVQGHETRIAVIESDATRLREALRDLPERLAAIKTTIEVLMVKHGDLAKTVDRIAENIGQTGHTVDQASGAAAFLKAVLPWFISIGALSWAIYSSTKAK